VRERSFNREEEEAKKQKVFTVHFAVEKFANLIEVY